MRQRILLALDSTRTVYAASALTLALGLIFTFVWAPHPWGWQGIDQYHELARELARGEPFSTTDVPWGYAYYVAASYYLFGEQVWIPVTVQSFINASVPILLYLLVRPITGQRTAVLSAVIVGVFSFNTIYVSTQVSDAICTVLFLTSLVLMARGLRTGRLASFALAGFVSGLVPQFRPNMILFPLLVAGGYVVLGRTRRHLIHSVVFVAFVAAALMPWVARNYRLTHTIMPTSTHGGVQLWYGTLQVGPYLESRAHNPRYIFESSPFPYTSLGSTPIVVSMVGSPCAPPEETTTLVYWTDRVSTLQRVAVVEVSGLRRRFEIPGQPVPTTVYYFLDTTRPGPTGTVVLSSPAGGATNPYVAFVTDDHLGDMDRHNDLLDMFDIVRIARHVAWGDPLTTPAMLDFDRDGRVTESDLSTAVTTLLPEAATSGVAPFSAIAATDNAVVITLSEQSTVGVPRAWRGRHTDLDVRGSLAGVLVSRWRTYTSVLAPPAAPPPDGCGLGDAVAFNDVFYRREPHLMGRYMALAFDNIGRDPLGFAAASAYRMVRLFIIWGTSDSATTQQFAAGRLAYTAGTILSATYFLIFLAGVVMAWRQRSALVWFLVPIAYVPLTICFVLTNMRYTVTIQPLMFAFVALVVVTGFRLDERDPGGRPRGGDSSGETARQDEASRARLPPGR